MTSPPQPHRPLIVDDLDLGITGAMSIYRCQKCGKWSHAQRKPKHHQRFIKDDGQPTPEGLLDRVDATYDHMNGFTEDNGWWIACGPFDTYEAVKVA